MNAPRTVSRPAPAAENWQADFVALLPRMERQLRREFRRLSPEAAAEAVQEGIAICLRAFVRLQRQDRAHDAYPHVLARFAARQVRYGRQIGGSLNARDPLSRYAQRRQGIQVESLDSSHAESGQRIEEALADRRTSIPERVALRIDMPCWLQGLSRRMRRIAKDLAIGCTTGEVADKYGLSASRISQIRQELYRSWEQFYRKDAMSV